MWLNSQMQSPYIFTKETDMPSPDVIRYSLIRLPAYLKYVVLLSVTPAPLL